MIKKHFNKIFIVIATCLMLVAGIFISTDRIKTVNADNQQMPYNYVYLNNWTSHNQDNILLSYGNRMWTDGINIYYSYPDGTIINNYVLDTTTSTWSIKTWTGLTSIDGRYIWTDGTNIYYSNYTSQYVLDTATSTWSIKTWNGFTGLDGMQIWTDGINIYYSYGSTQYVLDTTTSTWSIKTWIGLSDFAGRYMWTDGTNTYFSNGSAQYVLDTATSTWSVKTWNGLSNISGNYVWTDGTNIYYSNNTSQYVLDTTTSTWSSKTWTGLTNFSGYSVFDKLPGVIICYAYNSPSSGLWYTLDSQQITPPTPPIPTPEPLEYTTKWNFHSTSLTFAGYYFWSDGSDIYYSDGNTQKIIDLTDYSYTDKIWTGLTSFYGHYIWNDGYNFYYSNSSNQYVLDVSTSTWSSKSWTGLTNFSGLDIWTDGINYYYSDGGSTHYVLDLSTSTWSVKTFNGLSNFIGRDIWTDGTNIYYSLSGTNYILDITTSTWSSKSWTGLTNFDGYYVWNDGTNIYYSSSSDGNFVLDNNTWNSVSFANLTNFDGYCVFDSLPSKCVLYSYYTSNGIYSLALQPTYQDGYNAGYDDGYDAGVIDGYDDGYSVGHDAGYDVGVDAGYGTGYSLGYNDGIAYATNMFNGFGPFLYSTWSIVDRNDYTVVLNNFTGRFNSQDFNTYSGGFTFSTTLFNNIDNYFIENPDQEGVFRVVFDNYLPLTQYNNFITYNFTFGNEIYFYLDNGTTISFDNQSITTGISLDSSSNASIVSIVVTFASSFDDYGNFGLSANANYMVPYNKGFSDGYEKGHNKGHLDGFDLGRNKGYNEGVAAANRYTFLSLISAVVDAPFTYFTSMLNFEILGFNFFNFITGLLTLAFVLIVLKNIIGR